MEKELDKQISPEIMALIDQFPEYKDIILNNLDNPHLKTKSGEIIKELRSDSPASHASSPIVSRSSYTNSVRLSKDQIRSGSPASNSSSPISSDKGRCFIATAIYGSPFEKNVIILKKVRDEHLLNCPLGRKFITIYNKYSPSIAHYMSTRPILQSVGRILLNPIVCFSKWIINENNSQE